MQNLGTLTLIVMMAAMLTVGRVSAQTNPPSDRELFAGYCLGVANAKKAFLESMRPTPDIALEAIAPGSAKAQQDAFQRNAESLERDRQRFLGYLLLDANLDWTGVVLAVRNGEADVHDAMSAAKEGAAHCKFTAPTAEDIKNHGSDWFRTEWDKRAKLSQDCMRQIEIPASSRRFMRCDQPSSLPW
jgi:hypothetical protein